ncbi:MAG TPA: M23 family metallopeptidase [Bacteroidota bacterium]
MAEDRSHHKSKKRLYDILLVPSDDASQPKRMRLAPWQMIALLGGSVSFVILTVLLLLMFTPLGPLVPIPNPELENRYNKELLTINQRMSDVLQQLVELRTYNVKLRQALGENVTMTDSGVVVTNTTRSRQAEQLRAPEREQAFVQSLSRDIARPAFQPATERVTAEDPNRVVFPAVLPAEGFMTRGYDFNKRHLGLDIAGKSGSPVIAAAEGYVIFSGWTNEYGYVMILSHAGGFLTFYKHNQSLLKSSGSFAKRAEPIALMGNTGTTSTSTHVHFEIWKDGAPVDPVLYIINLNL